jgi:predicted lipoprotein
MSTIRFANWTAAALGLAALVMTQVPVRAEPQTHYQLTLNAIDGYVVPRLGDFETASRELSQGVQAFCREPSFAARDDVGRRFRDAVSAWAAAEIIRIGPATRDGRAQKIAFWPDPRGAVERQLRQALAQRQPFLTEPAALRAQSAALQGLPALEYLLADAAVDIGGTDEESRYRCRVASAIALNVSGLAHEIYDGWTRESGWRDHMLRPGSDNADYPSATAAATDLFKSLATSLQAIIEAEIQPLTGAEEKKPKPSSLPYRRLGLSRSYLLSGVDGCRSLYEAARLSGYLDASDPEKAKLAALVETAFKGTKRDIMSKAWDGLVSGKGSDDDLKTARAVSSMLASARRIIATKIAEAAEITLGFNELDGD